MPTNTGSTTFPEQGPIEGSVKEMGEPTRPPYPIGSGELFPNQPAPKPAPNNDEGELDAGDKEAKYEFKVEGWTNCVGTG